MERRMEMSQDFDKIFGQNSSLTPYTWSDTDYQKGWETVGQTPPVRTMFDALQRKNDLKAKELHDTLTPIAENADAHSRKGGTAYAVGDVMESSLLPIGYSLLCTTAGTTSSNVITIPDPLVEGATITDGTVVWTIIKTPTQRSLGYRQPSATVALGAVAYSESLPPSYYLECTTAGTTGTGALTISPVVLGSTVSDGTAVWEVKSWQYLGKEIVESTGYGIVSGCEPTISGLIVSVAAGVVHLANGVRKEISATTVTLDAADTTNPRIDLVYINSAGVVAKVTGTAAASPSAPALPTGGISVATVSVGANATTGTLADTRGMLPRWYNTGVVNVKDFGAVGDGVTDDTAAIQNALNHGSYVIFENQKIYFVTAQLDIKSYSYVDLNGSTVKYTPANGLDNCFSIYAHDVVLCNGTILPTNITGPMPSGNCGNPVRLGIYTITTDEGMDTYNVILRGLTIKGGFEASVGINLLGDTHNCIIENCNIIGGTTASESFNIGIMMHWGAQGATVSPPPTKTFHPHNIVIRNCYFENILGEENGNTTSSACIFASSCYNISVENCMGVNINRAIKQYAGDWGYQYSNIPNIINALKVSSSMFLDIAKNGVTVQSPS